MELLAVRQTWGWVLTPTLKNSIKFLTFPKLHLESPWSKSCYPKMFLCNRFIHSLSHVTRAIGPRKRKAQISAEVK